MAKQPIYRSIGWVRARASGRAGAVLLGIVLCSRSSGAAEPAAQAQATPPPAAQTQATAPPAAPAPPAATPVAPLPQATPGPAGAPPVVAPAPLAATWAAPSFGSDPLGAVASATDLVLKMYGDTGVAIRNNADQPWPTTTSNPDVYAPGVWNTFFAPRLDIFGAADVDKLSFLTEVMFEANNDNFTIDIERMQLNYLFANWLRVTAGRSHMAWGYYNDSYHHGNIFELTTSRPFSVNFEDSFGVILAHNVGVGIDGTFDLGSAGAIRYDAEIGNGRAADVTAVDMQFAEAAPRNYNVRLRWMPIDGLILGVNGMIGGVPALAVPSPAPAAPVPTRPQTQELVAGAHAVYTEHHLIVDIEGFAMRHNPGPLPGGIPAGLPSTSIYGGFAELGYNLGAFTPYVRPEYMVFPAAGDIIYQYAATDAQGVLGGYQSIYYGTRDFSDLRVGVKWLPLPQLALKLEGQRLARDSQNQEIATLKAAFGF